MISIGMGQAVSLVLGLVVGSFLNVVIYRLPRGESVVWPGSRCTDCGTPLRPIDLVPVLSFLFLRRRCRYCGARISWRYPLVESVTGVLFLLSYRRFGFGSQLPFALMLAGTVVAISAIDLEHRRIPNVIVLPAAVVGLVSALVTRSVSIHEALLGMAVGTLALGLLSIVSRGGMGMGDAKLLGMVGAWAGWRGMLLTLFGASVVASAIGLALIACRVIGRRQPIPFGPFLSICGYAVYIYGDRMLELWLG